MDVSRQTPGKISAHKKMPGCLVNPKVLKIEGCVVKREKRDSACYDCRDKWILLYGSGRHNEYPEYKSLNTHRIPLDGEMGERMQVV